MTTASETSAEYSRIERLRGKSVEARNLLQCATMACTSDELESYIQGALGCVVDKALCQVMDLVTGLENVMARMRGEEAKDEEEETD